jgi:hypothetical protein
MTQLEVLGSEGEGLTLISQALIGRQQTRIRVPQERPEEVRVCRRIRRCPVQCDRIVLVPDGVGVGI